MVARIKKPTLLAEQLNQYDPTLPLERASTIPSSWYSNEHVYEAERHSVFHDSWQCVARADQLREPGSFVTVDIAGEPVLLSRDRDGTLHAFANVCRHKAARIACDKEGTAKVFQCRYHGWTYDLKGQLRGAPEFADVCDFEKDDVRLPSYEIDTWGPLVFVNLNRSVREAEAQAGVMTMSTSLQDEISPLQEMHQAEVLSSLKFVERKEYVLECNWKIFIDNYLDGGYHVNTLHPGLAGVVNYTGYHTKIFDTSSVQISPLKQGSVSSVRSGDAAYYWWLFPNFMINIYEGLMDTNLVLPLGPNKCRVVFDFFFANTEGEKARAFIKESIKVAEAVQDEDVEICEDVQRGLMSSTYDTGRLSVKRETGIFAFHQLLAKRLFDYCEQETD